MVDIIRDVVSFVSIATFVLTFSMCMTYLS